MEVRESMVVKIKTATFTGIEGIPINEKLILIETSTF